jgi:hypothetical protein
MRRAGTRVRTRAKGKLKAEIERKKTSGSRRKLLRMRVFPRRVRASFTLLMLQIAIGCALWLGNTENDEDTFEEPGLLYAN